MLQVDLPPLVLASQSSARRALLAGAGIRFTIAPAAVDEEEVRHGARADGADAGEAAILLADLKARATGRRAPEALVIGADQILECEGTWLGKPPDLAAARAQLCALRGKAHRLQTAVVCHRDGARIWQHLAVPRLTMRDFSEAFLDAYLATEGEAVLGSVGAYRLEATGIQLFDRIDGDFSAILGLPLLPLLGFLRQHGILAG